MQKTFVNNKINEAMFSKEGLTELDLVSCSVCWVTLHLSARQM